MFFSAAQNGHCTRYTHLLRTPQTKTRIGSDKTSGTSIAHGSIAATDHSCPPLPCTDCTLPSLPDIEHQSGCRRSRAAALPPDGRVDGARTRTIEGCLEVDVAWCLPGHGTGKAGGGASPCVRAHFTSSVNVFKGSEEKDERGREKGST